MSITIAPPFIDPELAERKVQLAEDLWNTRDPQGVAAAYTEDSVWRNRHEPGPASSQAARREADEIVSLRQLDPELHGGQSMVSKA